MMAAGIRPNTAFPETDTGIEMFKGTIKVDEFFKNHCRGYLCGGRLRRWSQTASQRHHSGRPWGPPQIWKGRTLAQILAGEKKAYPGVLGTGVVKLPNLNCGRTGLTEAQAKAAGYDVITALVPTDDKAHYYPDASFFITKIIADKVSHKLLGVQVFGTGSGG